MTDMVFVGLDVHKATIAVATAQEGRDGEVRLHGTIEHTPDAVRTLAARLAKGGKTLRFCYEAGPCGYGLQRRPWRTNRREVGCGGIAG